MTDVVLGPICWVVALLLRLLHAGLGTVLDPDAGVTWMLSTLGVLVTVRVVLLPLALRQARAQARLRALAPQLAAAAREHAGSPNKIADARVKVYREAGISPLAGWMSLLVQVPVFMGLMLVLHRCVVLDEPGFGLSARSVDSFRHATLGGAPLAASLRSSSTQVVELGGSPTAAHVAVALAVAAAVAVTLLSAFLVLRQLRGSAGPVWFRGSLLVVSVVAMAATAAVLPLLLAIYLSASTAWSVGQGHWLRRRAAASSARD